MSDSIGTELKLNNGDLAYTMDGNLMLVEGIDNIWQSVTLSLTTTKGTNVFNSKYGTLLGKYVDEPITELLESKIASEVETTVLQDPRVTKVSNINVTGNNGLTVSFSILTISGEAKSGSVTVGG